ncbi:PHA/PHB synthase family protein [Nocardioides insulae]|uniref:PHA/PHB synthase family protein n=1 Tax=Nocardioides insulae TaxID=394734 RepID=UPI00040B657C|nr:alpha/beta fold hydrolase [Nocardioides insulae]
MPTLSPAVPPGLARSATGALITTIRSTPGVVGRAASLSAQLCAAVTGRSDLSPGRGDKRFADPAWTENPLYRRLGQAYLALEQAISAAVEDAEVDWATRERARFAAGILASTLAPTNTLAGNPAALKRVLDTGGGSVVRGGRNLVRDLRRHGPMPRSVDSAPFQLGDNLGTTPGEVVFRNEVVEIIQYAPSTPTVRSVPLLLVWSMVNKYYVLDLAADRSFIEHAVAQGIPVFVTSWRNPTKDHAEWGLDTYVGALVEAMTAIQEITGSERIGAVGLCSGGQLLAATMGHLAAIGDDRVAHASFGVSLLDMSVPNVAGILLHPGLVRAAGRATETAGIVEGKHIGAVFSWLRPNDLVWGNWVNNYLMGNQPPAFDILAWNDDTNRLPGALQRDLLAIAQDNLLAEPGELRVRDSGVDLGEVSSDVYVVGAETDHLVPWQGAYRSTQLFGGEATFVLSGGGHIQHLVNPPGNPRSHYRTGPEPGPDPEAWLQSAEQHQGTWWTHWAEWVATRSGEERPAPARLGSDLHPPLEPAPGRYVREA